MATDRAILKCNTCNGTVYIARANGAQWQTTETWCGTNLNRRLTDFFKRHENCLVAKGYERAFALRHREPFALLYESGEAKYRIEEQGPN